MPSKETNDFPWLAPEVAEKRAGDVHSLGYVLKYIKRGAERVTLKRGMAERRKIPPNTKTWNGPCPRRTGK